MDKLEKNLGGAPEKHIDYPMLDKLCAIHCTGEECAAILEMSYESLNNKLKAAGFGGFLDYFREKSASGKMSLRRKQYTSALDGNSTMLVWLGKQWLGQKDSSSIEHTGQGGGPIEYSNLTDDQLDQKLKSLINAVGKSDETAED